MIIRFQFAMIAFNHVVPVLNLSVFNVRRAPAFAFEQSKRATIGGRFIRVDESWDLPLLHVVEDFTQKPVCSFAVTTGGEIKIDSAAPAVDGLVQIRPAAIDLLRRFHPCATGKDRLRQYQRSRFSISGA